MLVAHNQRREVSAVPSNPIYSEVIEMSIDQEPIFYVYVYLDPRKPGYYVYGNYIFEYEPFYVGKGSNGRLYKHLHYSEKNAHNKHLYHKIKKIRKEHKSNPFIIKINEGLTEAVSFELEKELICVIGRHDEKLGPLCNHTDGGEGHICTSEEAREKMSKSQKGKIFSEETRKKISKACKGKKRSKETRQKMSERMKNIPDEMRKNLSIVNKRAYILNDEHPFKLYRKKQIEERMKRAKKAKLLRETGMKVKDIALALSVTNLRVYDYLRNT